ncbi:MAG: hypothetical protein ACPL0C_03170 [Candidatus Bathyarchaeales archaeon]
MKVKRAVIIVELVPESLSEDNKQIISELVSWFKEENALIPWVKNVKEVVIEDC